MVELFSQFPDAATTEAWFIQRRWPDGVACPGRHHNPSRGRDTIDIMAAMVAGVRGKRLRYRELTADNGLLNSVGRA